MGPSLVCIRHFKQGAEEHFVTSVAAHLSPTWKLMVATVNAKSIHIYEVCETQKKYHPSAGSNHLRSLW